MLPQFLAPLDIAKERDEIIKELKLRANKPNYEPLIGDDYMTLIDIFLDKASQYIEAQNRIIANNYLNFSQGEFLDELVKLVGITRKTASLPTTTLKIVANTPTFIAKGTRFTDLKGHFAYALTDLTLENVGKEYFLNIELADELDENFNTVFLEIPNIYISQIEQEKPFSKLKQAESDEELRKRFKLALHQFSTAGSKKSYLFHILSTDGIEKANVYQTSPGNVKIVYYSKLKQEIAEEKIRQSLADKIPLTDLITLSPANIIQLDLSIKIKPNADELFALAIKSADEKMRAFFDKLDVAQEVHTSQIIELAFSEFCSKVLITSDIPNVDKDSILRLRNLEILKAD